MRFLITPILFFSICLLTDSPSIGQDAKSERVLQKTIDDLKRKLSSGDQKTIISALKISAALKQSSKPLLPQITKLLINQNQQISKEAITSIEKIDQNYHAIIMGLKPPASWGNRTPALHKIMQSDNATFELYKPIIDWQLTMIDTLEIKKIRGKPKRQPLEPKGSGPIQFGEGLTGDELAVSQLIRILDRYPEKKRYIRSLAGNSLDAEEGRLRYQAFKCYVDESSNSLTINKSQLIDYLRVYEKGLDDHYYEINLMIARDIGKFGSGARDQLIQLKKVADTHPSKEVRAAATESIKKIEE